MPSIPLSPAGIAATLVLLMSPAKLSGFRVWTDRREFQPTLQTTRAIVKRRRTLALQFPVDRWFAPDDLAVSSGILAKEYATLSSATLIRDLAELKRLELIVKEKGRYKGNIEIMRGYLPMRKTK